ncbi:MAG: hypothetical protein KKB50_03175 [Planctomycetes bacterium]|nr:hypothetical protein [Planctomycetota bacterium]
MAALESDRKLEELSGAKSEAVTKLLEDCVAQYDESMRGVTKFYPGGVRVRYFLRSADVADVNVFVPEASTAVIHLRSISLR